MSVAKGADLSHSSSVPPTHEGSDASDRPLRSRVPRSLLAFRSIGLVAVHGLIFSAVYALAFLVRFDGAIPSVELALVASTLPIVVGVKLLAILATGSHRGWLRYVTFADLVKLVEATTLGSIGFALTCLLIGDIETIPHAIFILDWAGTVLVLSAARGVSRLVRERLHPWLASRSYERVLVAGSGEASETLVRKLRTSSLLKMRVVGFLDADKASHGLMVAGLPILGALEEARRIAARYRVDTVLVPSPSYSSRAIRALVASCGEIGVKVKVVPGFEALLSGGLTVQPRDVDINDLLCREPVRLDTDSVNAFLNGKMVLVTGASGSIGSVICRQVLAFRPAGIVLVDHNENGIFYLERELHALRPECPLYPCIGNIADANRLRTLFGRYRPQVVLHAAAHKHVPLMEANPGEAVKNNVLGTRTLVEEALRHQVEAFVMISTDKAVNPTSVMGACKRMAEMVVESLSGLTGTRLVTVRFGNVLGSTGSVVPIFKEQIRTGGPITVTHPDMTRFFMTIPEAAQLVLQAGALGSSGEIFVLDMGEPVKVLALARDMIRRSGLQEGRDIEIVFTGLRPGEKLFEELYNASEARLPTTHPKIFRAKHAALSSAKVWDHFNDLAKVIDGAPEDVIAALIDAVPGYRPGRSLAPRALETASDRTVDPSDSSSAERFGVASREETTLAS